MDEVRKLEAKGLARAKARSRRLRVSRIRSLIFRGSLALFLVLWAVVFVQLASGNDPALDRIAKTGHQQATPAARAPQESREPAPEFGPEFEEFEPEFEEGFDSGPGGEFEAQPEVELEEPEPVITGSS
jgi:hypothetical protein